MTKCVYKQTGTREDGQFHYECVGCGHKRTARYEAKHLHRKCRQPISLADRIRAHLENLAAGGKVTRPQTDIDRYVTYCLEQCDLLGTGQWGEVKYDGCPLHGRPCRGSFDKWMRTLTDATLSCYKWDDLPTTITNVPGT